jgi:hypothetical protein
MKTEPPARVGGLGVADTLGLDYEAVKNVIEV